MSCNCNKKAKDFAEKYGDGEITEHKLSFPLKIVKFIMQMLFGILVGAILIVMLVPMMLYIMVCIMFGLTPTIRIKDWTKKLNKQEKTE